MNPFHYLFDKMYPLIRWYHERVNKNPWYSQIEPLLWLGGAPTRADDYSYLLDNNIKAVLDVRAEREDDRALYERAGIAYLRLPVLDMLIPNSAQFDEGVDFIAGHVAAGRPVLVHCAKGRGRSAVVLAAYLMKHRAMRFDEAVDYLRAKRRLVKQEARHQRAAEAWFAQAAQAGDHSSTMTDDAA